MWGSTPGHSVEPDAHKAVVGVLDNGRRGPQAVELDAPGLPSFRAAASSASGLRIPRDSRRTSGRCVKQLGHYAVGIPVRNGDVPQDKAMSRLNVPGHADLQGGEAVKAKLLAEADNAPLRDLQPLGQLFGGHVHKVLRVLHNKGAQPLFHSL